MFPHSSIPLLMSSALKNLSAYDPNTVPSAAGMKFGLVVSDWNEEITGALRNGAVQTLLRHGASADQIYIRQVPGSFELPLGARWMAMHSDADAIICLGCVIQGETRHFDFICDAVAHGLTSLNLELGKPFIFGVLTPNDMDQARARAGGKHGNKGDEAAITAIKMVALRHTF